MSARSSGVRRIAWGGLAATAIVVLAAPLAAGAASADPTGELAEARAATARHHSLRAAAADGYGAFPAGVPLHECIADGSGHGAMGVHWVDGALLDAEVDAAQPEVLVYEPTREGRLRLVAVEYVVPAAAWAAEHGTTVPQLFGVDMTYVGEPNRYEIPAFWQRHAWIWKHNPMGVLADHNPAVSCEHW